RRDDIPVLIDHFQKQISNQNNWKATQFTPEAMAELQRYPWPGNVRELRNMIERLLLLATNNLVDDATVRMALPAMRTSAPNSAPDGHGTLAERMDQVEKSIILAELDRQQHHVTNTAKALGVERSHLYKKCQQLGLTWPRRRRGELTMDF